MRTILLTRRLLAAALAFTAAGAFADPPVRTPPAPAVTAEPPSGADRVEILVRFPPFQFTGTFRATSASGALGDAGAVRDVGALLVPGAPPVERILHGEHGSLTLRLHGVRQTPGFPPVFGRWTLVRGTGRYESLRGEGTFTSVGAGDGNGGPFEIQTLLGHVHR